MSLTLNSNITLNQIFEFAINTGLLDLLKDLMEMLVDDQNQISSNAYL